MINKYGKPYTDSNTSSIRSKVGSLVQYIINKLCRTDVLVGVVDHVSAQFAYVVINGGDIDDIYVAKDDLMHAINGDTVKVRVGNKRKFNHPRGKVLQVISHGPNVFVGNMKKTDKSFVVRVSDKKFYWPIKIKEVKLLNEHYDVQCQYKVKVKITEFPVGDGDFIGEILECFGKVGDHETEIRSIMSEYGLTPTFSMFSGDRVAPEVDTSRRDFRNVFTVTIDPATAKDFDDALSIQILDNGYYQVGVHIADVSHFVLEGTDLDKEAYKRNTSVYLVDRVVPMLPEYLCNDLCSLVQGEDRLTMSIVFEMDIDGNIHSQWIGEAVICSDKRMTYEEAQSAIDDQFNIFHDNICVLHKIAQQLRAKRIEQGAINFEFSDINFSVDDDLSLRMFTADVSDSHHLVEEFMLLANRSVAEYGYAQCVAHARQKPCFLYRVHGLPDSSKVSDFAFFVKQFGLSIEEDIAKLPGSLNALISSVKGKPEENVVLTFAVKMMQKAVYSTAPKRHFGLGMDHYTHFTSPIRRYPDVLVHRLVKKFLSGTYSCDKALLDAASVHAIEREDIAVNAERDSIKFKQVEFAKAHYVGQKITGIISGVTEWGIFVEFGDVKCEGLIRFADYDIETFFINRIRTKVTGKYTGNIYCIGDSIKVIVKKCNTESRTIDLMFA